MIVKSIATLCFIVGFLVIGSLILVAISSFILGVLQNPKTKKVIDTLDRFSMYFYRKGSGE